MLVSKRGALLPTSTFRRTGRARLRRGGAGRRAAIGVVIALGCASAALVGGCGEAPSHNPLPTAEASASVEAPTANGVANCGAEAVEGCPCSTVGATAFCRFVRTANDYVSCGPGERVCGDDGVWGKCIPQQ
jgi:hypothetical protein